MSSYAEIKMDGATFVLVPKKEFRQFVKSKIPPLPPRNADGNYNAMDYIHVSIARDIIRRREAAKLSQKALAIEAGIRVETLNRLEKGKVSADTRTILKIEKALKQYGV